MYEQRALMFIFEGHRLGDMSRGELESLRARWESYCRKCDAMELPPEPRYQELGDAVAMVLKYRFVEA